MRSNYFKAILKRAVQGATVLLLGAGVAKAQVSLTAAQTVTTLPDGSTVPMWGYSCGAPATGINPPTCAALNPGAAAVSPATWSPVLITVPYTGTATSNNTTLTISLTNSLSFQQGTTTTATQIPTSIVIVGQVGGGLGSSRTTTASPDHSALSSNTVTWPVAGTAPSFVPPPQGPRVVSMATEVATGATTTLTWSHLKPGTYLLESGTHPSIQVPMGLYGILVVTNAPTVTTTAPIQESAAGTAYPGVAANSSTTPATPAVPAVTYDAEVPLEFSEIDPVQNAAVSKAVTSVGFSEATVWSGQPGGCGNPSTANSGNCYPPAVNYTPLYYMINGVAFNKTNAPGSLFPAMPATIVPAAGTGTTTGSVLVRMVNAGLKMHVPSIVGSQVAGATGGTNPVVTGFKIIAEDGNPLPGVPKVKSEVFMAAGKTHDVMINGMTATGAYANALPVFDRELSLSGNAVERDAGMLAYIGINGSTIPSNIPAFGAAQAIADTYNALVAGQTLTVTDPSKGVMANDINVYGVTLLAGPTNGTVTLNRNGTFTYVSSGTATTDSFTYCANGTVSGTSCSSGLTATVTLGGSNIVDTAGVKCAGSSYSAVTANYLAIKTPGVLSVCTDGANLPLTVDPATVAATGSGSQITIHGDANGGFTAVAPGPGIYTFTFEAQNSHGLHSAATTVTLNFPAGSGLNVTVLDGQDKATKITDYRWVIEEDRTFYINPNCTANPPPAGCPTANITGIGAIVPTLGTNFHTSYMPYVAQGCTGAQSCESGQTVRARTRSATWATALAGPGRL